MILAASFMGWRNNNPTCAECCLAIVQSAAELKEAVTDRTAMNVRRQQLVLSAVSARALQSADDERLGFDVVEEDVENVLPESGSTATGNNMAAREDLDVHETTEDPYIHKTQQDLDIHERQENLDVHETPEDRDVHETPEEPDIYETSENPDVHKTPENPDTREAPNLPDTHETQM